MDWWHRLQEVCLRHGCTWEMDMGVAYGSATWQDGMRVMPCFYRLALLWPDGSRTEFEANDPNELVALATRYLQEQASLSQHGRVGAAQ